MHGIMEYDDDGNLIHESFSDGSEYWKDEKGQFFHEKGSGNEESWWYYPENKEM